MENPSTSQAFPDRRSASRTSTSIEIILRGSDKQGKAFVEKTRTVNISPTGARILTEHAVSLGTRLQIAIPHLQRMSWATVAWVGDKAGNLQEVGISIDETSGFWGVQLPDTIEASRRVDRVAVPSARQAEEIAAVPAMNPSAPNPQQAQTSVDIKAEIATAALESERETPDKLSQVLQELARGAIEQSLGEALQQLNQKAAEIRNDLHDAITKQAEDRLRQSMVAAVQHIETASQDLMRRNQPAWEQTIQTFLNSAKEQMGAQLAEHEARLLTSAARIRRDLARKLADIATALDVD